jgi:thiol-disulfide isomerase/thioredoxin
MVTMRRLPVPAIVATTALALVVAVGAAVWLDDDPQAEGGTESQMDLAPEGELPESTAAVRLGALGEGGTDRTLGELLGTRPVVLNFFASWCAPCIDEMPAFERVHQSLGDRVTIVGMAYRNSDEEALDTVARTGVTYPTYSDEDGSALTWFQGVAMPSTVFLDAAGEVVDVHSGPLTEDELRAKLRDLLGVA